jgi:nucleotide-binding universal stress UspA family protein
MFQHILVPVDGSPLSLMAAERAVAYAKASGARITFFYACPEEPAIYAGLGTIIGTHISQDIKQRFNEAAGEILSMAEKVADEAGMQCQKKMLVDIEPYKLIIEIAEASACDMIFMASHGRQGASALLLGSETNKVLTHCKLPVLVYR